MQGAGEVKQVQQHSGRLASPVQKSPRTVLSGSNLLAGAACRNGLVLFFTWTGWRTYQFVFCICPFTYTQCPPGSVVRTCILFEPVPLFVLLAPMACTQKLHFFWQIIRFEPNREPPRRFEPSDRYEQQISYVRKRQPRNTKMPKPHKSHNEQGHSLSVLWFGLFHFDLFVFRLR